MMKRILLLLIISSFFTPLILAQEDCSILLRRAQKYYDDGIIEEVPALLTKCLENGFTREERIDASKLLILCSIYEDKIDQADKQMLAFLKTNPEYEINKSIDAAEFIHFFNSYKTSEIISLGFTFGTNFTHAYYIEKFGVEDLNASDTKYANSGFGLIFGPTFSRPLVGDFEISVSALYAQKKFEYATEVTDFSDVKTIETQNYLEFPLIVSYYKYGGKKFKPYVAGGINTSLLINATSQSDRTYSEGNHDDLTGKEIEIKLNRNKLLFGISLGSGIEYKFNKGSVNALLRYNFGVNSVNNENQRYSNQDEVFKNYLIDDKVIINNIYFSVSYMYPLYNHKKIN